MKGQLGTECQELLTAAGHEIFGADLPEWDLTVPAVIERLLKEFKPEVIVNCAAFTRVDDCETQRDKAWQVNAELPARLAAGAAAAGARLIHISTDYVFSGDRPIPQAYVESDATGPVSWYGKSKLAGEQAVLKYPDCRPLILRTAWLYSRTGRNFPKTMLRLALTDPDRVIRVVNEQFGSPTWSRRLAMQIAEVLKADPPSGVYHATAEGYCTWCEFAGYFLRAMQVPHRLEPCRSADYPTPAKRPLNSILENARLNALGISVMTDWRADVDEFVRTCRAGLLAEVPPVSPSS